MVGVDVWLPVVTALIAAILGAAGHRAVTSKPAQPGGIPAMDLTTLKNDFQNVMNTLENVDTEVVGKVAAIKANPEAAAVLDVLGPLAETELPPGVLTAFATIFQAMTGAARPPATAPAAPAAPAPPAAPAAETAGTPKPSAGDAGTQPLAGGIPL